MVAIIDYDAGNIKSVEKAIQFLGEDVIVTRNPAEILNASGVILPGVSVQSRCGDKSSFQFIIAIDENTSIYIHNGNIVIYRQIYKRRFAKKTIQDYIKSLYPEF